MHGCCDGTGAQVCKWEWALVRMMTSSVCCWCCSRAEQMMPLCFALKYTITHAYTHIHTQCHRLIGEFLFSLDLSGLSICDRGARLMADLVLHTPSEC